MTLLIFVRHGETAWSRSKTHTFRGRADIPLTNNGRQQARAVGLRLKYEELTCIYSSPLKRAYDTASEIALHHGLPVIKHIGFIDLDFGTWQGITHEEIRQQYPQEYIKWQNNPETITFPGGETLKDVHTRVERALPEIRDKHGDETVVIVAHGAVLRVVMCYLNNDDLSKYWQYEMDNCSFTKVKFIEEDTIVLVENENMYVK